MLQAHATQGPDELKPGISKHFRRLKICGQPHLWACDNFVGLWMSKNSNVLISIVRWELFTSSDRKYSLCILLNPYTVN
jgi:hypothetical protein